MADKMWSFEEVRGNLDHRANMAENRLQEILRYKDMESWAYQREHDEALARFFAFNHPWRLQTRESFLDDLRKKRDTAPDGVRSGAQDPDRAERFWTQVVAELIESYEG